MVISSTNKIAKKQFVFFETELYVQLLYFDEHK